MHPPREFQEKMATKNERLEELELKKLSIEEFYGARLYTGPMFMKYNAVLRGLPDVALPWLKKKMETYRENAEDPPLSDFIKYFVESGATMDDESIIRSGQQWRKRSGSIGSLSLSPDSPMVVEEGCTDMSTLVQPPPMVVDEAEDQQPAVTEKKGGFKMPAKKVGFQPPTVTAAVSPASSPSSSSKGSMKKISKKNVAAKRKK